MDHAVKLVRMANQIADFFRSFPEDEAVAGIHEHIVAFWSPVMRRDLVAHVNANADGIDSLVAAAVHALASGRSPTNKETAGPAEVGAIGASDAG